MAQAFNAVQDQFFWDSQRWISAAAAGDLLTDFTQQLSAAPVNLPLFFTGSRDWWPGTCYIRPT